MEGVRLRREGSEAGEEVEGVEGVEDDMGRPVLEGALESVDDLSPLIDRETVVRDR